MFLITFRIIFLFVYSCLKLSDLLSNRYFSEEVKKKKRKFQDTS